MGWKETIVNEHGGVENNPVKISVIRRIIVDPAERETPRTIPHVPGKPD
jgi:hypothetical protein